jgi:hypothetical protein
MRIDPARQHQQPCRIDDRVALRIDPRAHLSSRAALDQHIGGHRPIRVDYDAVLYQQSH